MNPIDRRKLLQSAAVIAATAVLPACAQAEDNGNTPNRASAASASASSSNTVKTGGWARVKTLLIVSHPYPDQSVMIKGLQQAAETVDNVTVRNLESIYGFDSRAIDGEAERRITREHDRIVFMFPTHWFNITPMMKAYLNDTWGSVGPGLWQGKEMLIITTAAGGGSTYGKNGRIGVPLADVFLPMKASALHAGMIYLPPLAFEGVTPSRLGEYQRQVVEQLTR
ncbi:NAD(P)H-dependent oxidoreductase [Eikenella sp. S3360]|uniref:NAD(P)H-dependent oxidoreductase n=1 Tax=Eikenella glucosivorans TaxID=2766967 RepID=A0ABS0NB09_9NEIS|nr:NAD(P)H-dependent oxidoreductase [Eikenella glucosivorans]MBH5329504.1 NAD(P)H-dependent oxidoreductase [Eikenella glucosivorans]